MFRILIIEDRQETAIFLKNEINPAIKQERTGNFAWVSSWPSYKSIDFDVQILDDDSLATLIQSASACDSSEFENIVRKIYYQYHNPEMVIIDLALTQREIEIIQNDGKSTDATGLKKSKSETEAALKKLTGYKLIEIFRKCPCFVLTNTLSANPHIEVFCLEQGSHAFLRKPLKPTDMKILSDISKADYSRVITQKQRDIAKKMQPKIDNYLARLTNEVVRAVRDIALARSCGASPKLVPFWSAVNMKQIIHHTYDNTSLMLMDIRGFSKIVELVSSQPDVVFELINIIWDEIYKVLTNYNAEINNFIGDAALVFRGVYDETTFDMKSTLDCALELCRLFSQEGVIRDAMVSHPSLVSLKNLDDADIKYNELINLIKSENFGLRIVVAQPDPKEALFGKVGAGNSRWQHTILSRFMNMLSRIESAVGSWEKEGEIEKKHGHCFLLWVKGNQLPQSTTFKLSSQPFKPIRNVHDNVELFRVDSTEEVEQYRQHPPKPHYSQDVHHQLSIGGVDGHSDRV